MTEVINREIDFKISDRWLTKKNVLVDYPKSGTENLKFRLLLLNKCETDENLRHVIKERCRRDIWYFFNVFLFTFDPRTEGKSLPFITYEFQDEYLWDLDKALNSGYDLLTEKSRAMGASWLMLGFLLHKWLFKPKFTALLGSYIEDLVDNRTIDSHFGRLDYLLDRLPEWMRPNGFDMGKHRNSMKLDNPETEGIINGYAPTERFSRAGRYDCIFVDELAFWKHARSAWTAMGDATKVRYVTSTPNGKGNLFADLALKSTIKKCVLHWRQHPLKDEAWYENEKKRRTEEEVAQELDINYNKSVTGRVYPGFDEWNFNETQKYNKDEPLFVSWDFGLSDETALIWLQVNREGTVRIIDSFQKSGVGIDFFVPFVTGEIKSFRKYKYTDEEFEKIEAHKGWQDAIHYGDPTGDNMSQTSRTSVIKQLREIGIYVQSKRGIEFTFKQRHTATQLLIRRLKVDKSLDDFIDAMQNARFPKKSELSQSTNEVTKPIHDWTSHYRTALEFYAVNEDLRRAGRMRIVNKVSDTVEDMFDSLSKLRPKNNSSKLNGKKYKTCA